MSTSGDACADGPQRTRNQVGDPAGKLLSALAGHAVLADFQAGRVSRPLDNSCAPTVRT